MAKSIRIETNRLIIEPFTKKYLTHRYVNWLNDPEVVRYSDQRLKKHSLESCHQYMQSFEGTPNYFWALTERDSTYGHIGNMNAYIDNKNLTADLGILIGEKNAWMKGYGTEAWLAVCNYLFDSGIKKLTAGTLPLNSAMIALMRRVGMKEDINMTQESFFEGKRINIIKMSLYRPLSCLGFKA